MLRCATKRRILPLFHTRRAIRLQCRYQSEISTDQGEQSESSSRKLRSKHIILTAKETRLIRDRPKISFEPLNDIDISNVAQQLLIFKEEEPEENVHDSITRAIDSFKPKMPQISEKRAKQLCSLLSKAFLYSQLKQYATERGFHASRHSSTTLAGLSQFILKEIWKTEISSDIDAASDFIVNSSLRLSKMDCFFLLVNGGDLPRSWIRQGATIEIDPVRTVLKVRSTKDVFNWIVEQLDKVRLRQRTATVDLSVFEKIGADISKIPLRAIAQLSECYTEMTGPSELLLTALADSKLDEARRLLFASLDLKSSYAETLVYNTQLDKLIESDKEQLALFPVSEDDNVPWNQRGRHWARLRQSHTRRLKAYSAEPVTSERGRMSRLTMEAMSKDQKGEIQVQVDEEEINNTLSLSSSSFSAASNDSNSVCNIVGPPALLERVAQSGVLSTLSPQQYAISSPGDVRKLLDASSPQETGLVNEWEEPLYAATFGHILFETGFKGLQPGMMADELAQTSRMFCQTMPFLTNYVKRNLGLTQFLDNNMQDLHTYFLQIRLAPSPYEHPDEFMKLPPVEIWMQMDNQVRADISAPIAKFVGSETCVDMMWPHRVSDVRFSRTLLGDVIDSTESINAFLENSYLEFGTSRPAHVPHTLNLDVGGRKVAYIYQWMQYRCELDFEHEGFTLQHAVVEGGKLGGRRFEANLLCNPGGRSSSGNDAYNNNNLNDGDDNNNNNNDNNNYNESSTSTKDEKQFDSFYKAVSLLTERMAYSRPLKLQD